MCKRILILVFILATHIMEAHNPDEITYDIVINKNKQELVIHFTPLSAIHLLENIKPELKGKSVINLADYAKDFEAYFNKTLILELDGEKVYFKQIASQLNEHDATLSFAITQVKPHSSNFKIAITSYNHIYKRIVNYVKIDLYGDISICVLNKEKTSYSSEDEFFKTKNI